MLEHVESSSTEFSHTPVANTTHSKWAWIPMTTYGGNPRRILQWGQWTLVFVNSRFSSCSFASARVSMSWSFARRLISTSSRSYLLVITFPLLSHWLVTTGISTNHESTTKPTPYAEATEGRKEQWTKEYKRRKHPSTTCHSHEWESPKWLELLRVTPPSQTNNDSKSQQLNISRWHLGFHTNHKRLDRPHRSLLQSSELRFVCLLLRDHSMNYGLHPGENKPRLIEDC